MNDLFSVIALAVSLVWTICDSTPKLCTSTRIFPSTLLPLPDRDSSAKSELTESAKPAIELARRLGAAPAAPCVDIQSPCLHQASTASAPWAPPTAILLTTATVLRPWPWLAMRGLACPRNPILATPTATTRTDLTRLVALAPRLLPLSLRHKAAPAGHPQWDRPLPLTHDLTACIPLAVLLQPAV